MVPRASETLSEGQAESLSAAGTWSREGQGQGHACTTTTTKHLSKLRIEAHGQTEEWDKKNSSPETAARARTSTSWKRSSPVAAASEKSVEEMLLSAHRKSREEAMDTRAPLRSWARSPWSCSLLILITTTTAFMLLFSVVHSALNRQLDRQGCIMSTMSPTYIKLSGFDTEHTRFATKYSLYLYREEGVDDYTRENIGLRGAPVLFLPGNAGSYKQVRSLSSEASRYFHNSVRHDQEAIGAGTRSLDFFTIDFNEDLAAFHGQTLLDQAEYVNEAVAYILSLYHDPRRAGRDPHLPDPSSVILIGHSMGGIVARTVLVTANYQPNSVNTIITISSPHARPPVSFDAEMIHAYRRINDYWRESYSQKWANNNPLWQTTLISIAGGGLDTTVPSDYASLSSLVPETHGLTVFTSTIPDVWTAMDHLSITWCDQFRKVVIKSLFEIVDVRRAAQTKPRAERMRIFRKWYLTGLEDEAPKSLHTTDSSVLLTLGESPHSTISPTRNVTLRKLGVHGETTATLLSIPVLESAESKRLSVMTDQTIDKTGGFEKIEVLFCSAVPLQNSHSVAMLPLHIDLSENDPGTSRWACKRAAGDGIHLPASTKTSKLAFEQVRPFTYLQYSLTDLEEYQFVAIVDKATQIMDGWVFAEIAESSESLVKPDIGLRRLLTTGLRLDLPAVRPMMNEIRVPALHSSLLAYHLRLDTHGCGDGSELFEPLLRQHVDAPYESKYFVNMKQADINLHGIAPFMPPPLKGEAPSDGISFQIWSDTTCDAPMSFSLSVDITGSLGKLVVRYRTVFVAFPLLVVAMVLRKQFRIYDDTGIFITFTDSLDQNLRGALPVLMLAMTVLATSFTGSTSASFGSYNQANATEPVVNYDGNDLLLGSQDPFFWFLVPLAVLISIGACVAVNYLALAIVYTISLVHSLLIVIAGYARKNGNKKPAASTLIPSSPRRRIINTCVLLILVSTFIPYQFAYVVACIVQLATCTRALRCARESRSMSQHNFFNYAQSMLVIMLWILPINVPVLVVWVHNLSVHWLTPFSSHHNVLSIMPFILLVETLASGSMVPRTMSRVKYLTNVLFFFLATFSAIYGVSYAYRLHHLVNLVALWLVILHFSTLSAFSLSELSNLLENEGDLETADVKKMP